MAFSLAHTFPSSSLLAESAALPALLLSACFFALLVRGERRSSDDGADTAGAAAAVLTALEAHLPAVATEAALLHLAARSLSRLVPTAHGVAVGVLQAGAPLSSPTPCADAASPLPPPTRSRRVSRLHVYASGLRRGAVAAAGHEGNQQAIARAVFELRASLLAQPFRTKATSAASPTPADDVALACGLSPPHHSGPSGAAGVVIRPGRLTVPLTAGGETLGFLYVEWGAAAASGGVGGEGAAAAMACQAAALAAFAKLVGGALFVRRVFGGYAKQEEGEGDCPSGEDDVARPSSSSDASHRRWQQQRRQRSRARPSQGRMSQGRMSQTGAQAPAAATVAAAELVQMVDVATHLVDIAAAADTEATNFGSGCPPWHSELFDNDVTDHALLADWGTDVGALPPGEQRRLLLFCFRDLQLLALFDLRRAHVASFLDDVSSRYNSHPRFHTWGHAVCVAVAAWRFVAYTTLRSSLLTDLDVFALLCAAVCHDVGHEGLTNAYHVHARTPLGILYNDISVNEQHHAAVGFACVARAGLTGTLTPGEYTCFRKVFVAAVLSTDSASAKPALHLFPLLTVLFVAVSSHPALLARIEARVAPPSGCVACPLSPDVPEDRSGLVSFLLHCADLSNAVLPPKLAARNAASLASEFAAQEAIEAAAGLPTSLPTAHNGAAGLARREVGFLDLVALPTFLLLGRVAPELGHLTAAVEANRAYYSVAAEAQ